VTSDHAQPITDAHRENVERNGDAVVSSLIAAIRSWRRDRELSSLRRALLRAFMKLEDVR